MIKLKFWLVKMHTVLNGQLAQLCSAIKVFMWNGYNELLKQQIPLPSERTLWRRKESVKFQEGILSDEFDILQKQVSLFKDDREKDAAIAIDKMNLICGEQFDPSTQTNIGSLWRQFGQ